MRHRVVSRCYLTWEGEKGNTLSVHMAIWLNIEILRLQITFFHHTVNLGCYLGASNNSFWRRAVSAKKKDGLGCIVSNAEMEGVVNLKFQNMVNKCTCC